MTYATRANGRRAAHERSKQKDLNELDLEFTQILLPVQTLRSLSVTCKEGRKVVDQQFWRDTVDNATMRCDFILQIDENH